MKKLFAYSELFQAKVEQKNLCRGVDSYNNDDRYKQHHHKHVVQQSHHKKVAQGSPTQPNTKCNHFLFSSRAIVGNKSRVQSMRPGQY